MPHHYFGLFICHRDKATHRSPARRLDMQLHIQSSGGRTMRGLVTMTDEKTEVVMRHEIEAELPKANIAAIRNDTEEKVYQQSLNHGILQNWDGGGSLSFALTRGNSE